VIAIGSKLEDGNVCKECRAKLSPFFSDRRSSTINDIKEQLKYRESNAAMLSSFIPNITIGDLNGSTYVVYVSQQTGKFVVSRSKDYIRENADLIPISSVTSCTIAVDEDRDEIYNEKADGTRESYNPRRYKYEYRFDVTINVNHPYFDEIKYELTQNHRPESPYSDAYRHFAEIASQLSMVLTGRAWQPDTSRFQFKGDSYGTMNNGFGYNNQNAGFAAGIAGAVAAGVNQAIQQQNMGAQGYNQAYNGNAYNQPYNGNQNIQQQAPGYNYANTPAGQGFYQQNPAYQQTPVQTQQAAYVNNAAPVQQAQATDGWTCPSCGMANTGKFCQGCGSPRPATGCTACGWQPTAGAQLPKFCPECGKPF